MTAEERVKLSRNRTCPQFPLPVFNKCVRYAIQECGETDDAWMRIEEPGHKRNNERQPDPRREWGQVGYMILSAAIQRGKDRQFRCDHVHSPAYLLAGFGEEYFGRVVMALGMTLIYDCEINTTLKAVEQLRVAFAAWVHVCRCYAWDPDELIDETCMAFETKHAAREAANNGRG